jgi:hypothetical protein
MLFLASGYRARSRSSHGRMPLLQVAQCSHVSIPAAFGFRDSHASTAHFIASSTVPTGFHAAAVEKGDPKLAVASGIKPEIDTIVLSEHEQPSP